MGQNHIKKLFSLAFQSVLIVACIAIYAELTQSVLSNSGSVLSAMLEFTAFTVLLCMSLKQTSTLSDSIFVAH